MQTAKTMVAVEAGSEPFISRWSIPVAGLLLTLMGGISYAWGVFVVPLQERFGWTRADAMLPLSVYLVVFTTVGMIYGGILQDKFGPRRVAAAGGILFFLGYLMATQIDRFPYVWWLILTYGIIGGLGCAGAYCVAVPTARKWFPDRTVLAVSVAVTGFGLAATIFAPWLTRLIRTVGIEGAFLTLGAVTSIITLICAWVVRNPVSGWVPPGWEAISTGGTASLYASRTESTLGEALKTPLFYLLWLGFFGVIFGGLMAMAHVVPYGVTILGMERPAAAIASVYFGLANGFGRPVAGMIGQKIGPVKVMLATYLVTAICFFLFNGMATTPATLYLFAFIFGWGFAVTLGLWPSLTTIAFGAKNLGAVYGGVITAFGAAAYFGPMAAAWAYDLYKSYVMPFALAGTLSFVGWLICLFAYRMKYKMP
jgi:OFA family oxalate/formate antiporter-like MFS transporter